MGFSCTVNMSIIDEMSNPPLHVFAPSRGYWERFAPYEDSVWTPFVNSLQFIILK